MINTTVAVEGFEGILFPVGDRQDRIVIVVSRSNDGMSLTKKCAEFYYKNGIPALGIALFKTKGTQKNLDRVPIEFIESAVKNNLQTSCLTGLRMCGWISIPYERSNYERTKKSGLA